MITILLVSIPIIGPYFFINKLNLQRRLFLKMALFVVSIMLLSNSLLLTSKLQLSSILSVLLILLFLIILFIKIPSSKFGSKKHIRTDHLFLYTIPLIFFIFNILGGEWTWDAINVHQPIALAIHQNASIIDLPNISPWEFLPANPHLYMALWIKIVGSVLGTQVAMLIPLFLFIEFAFFWIEEIAARNLVSNFNKFLIKIILVSSPPLLMTAGTSYVDFFSQYSLLIALYCAFKLLSGDDSSKLNLFLIALGSTFLVSSKLSGVFQSLTLLSFIFAFLVFRKKINELIFFSITTFLILILNLTYFMRNYIVFKNPIYPYKEILGINFKSFIYTKEEMSSFLQGAASPLVSNTGNLYATFWNLFGSIMNWIEIHINIFRQVLRGSSDFKGIFNVGSVYSLDARVAGNGILLQFMIALLFVYILSNIIFHKSFKYFSIVSLCLLMLIAVPGPQAARYNWAIVLSMFILSSEAIPDILNFKIIRICIIGISIGSIFLAFFFQNLYYKEQKVLASRWRIESPIKNNFYPLKGSELDFQIKCPIVNVKRNLKVNSFPTIFWLGGTCSQIFTRESAPEIWDYTVNVISNSQRIDQCLRLVNGPFLLVADKWGQGSVLFHKTNNSSLLKKIDQECSP